MALMSSDDTNENSNSKTSTRNKYKYAGKKLKLKTKLKLKKHVSSVCERNGIYSLPQLPAQNISTMLSSYPMYTNYLYPVASDWTPVIPVPSPVYTINLPVVVNPVQLVTTQVCPYIGVVPSISSPISTSVNEILQSNLEPLVCQSSLYKTDKFVDSYYALQYVENYLNTPKDLITEVDDFITYSNEIHAKVYNVEEINDTAKLKQNGEIGDPLQFYLTLPKSLFPAARTLTVDPNPIIDEFCKIPNIQKHAPWILDLEFGVPNLPITRLIPTYNVKLNSINCKNAPDAIHPGFESCDKGFKEVLLFYYDCVISSWYRGYIILNNDRSVENFQSWLLLPAQVLGMCWS